MSERRSVLIPSLAAAIVVAASSFFVTGWLPALWTAIVVFVAVAWASVTLLRKFDVGQSERERVASEGQTLLKTIVDNSPAVVYAKTLKGEYMLVNRCFEELMGLRAQDMLGKTNFDLFDENVANAFQVVDERAASSDVPIIEEEVVPQEDGIRHFLSVKALLRDASEKPYAIFGISTDITDRKRAEAERQLALLREQRAREEAEAAVTVARIQLNQLHLLAKITRAIGEHQKLECIFDVVVRSLEEELPSDFACVCTHDAEGDDFVVRQVSAKRPSIVDELEVSEGTRIDIAESVLDRCVSGEVFYDPDISIQEAACFQSLHACGLSSIVFSPLMFEKRLLGIVVVGRAAANGFSRGETEFFEQLCEHIALAVQHTELFANLQRAYDDLRASQQTMLQQERLRSLGQLASGIAHDINNAISPASVYVDSILDHDNSLSPRTREQLKTVQRAVGDVSQTVARMRGFHRPAESSDGFRPVEPGRLVAEVLELTRPRWTNIPQQKGVVIELDQQIDKDLPTILGAESEIRDSLTNLIFNAVDAMPDGGTLRLRAYSSSAAADSAEQGRKVVLEVADTGVGMDAATKDRCLEPFFSTKGERGSGLGLAMVYGMSQRHGAELEIDSQVGRGTCVRLRFIARSASSGNGAVHPGHLPPGRPLRLLVIDDDPRVLASLSDALMSEGHMVEVALGGQAGIDQFRATRPSSTAFDAVITDLGMPHVDGRRVALEIRRVNARTPVILLTGWGQRLRDEGDVPEGVSLVLSKPARLQELRSAFDSLVAK
jgi:PAS domain S-box-containing protein